MKGAGWIPTPLRVQARGNHDAQMPATTANAAMGGSDRPLPRRGAVVVSMIALRSGERKSSLFVLYRSPIRVMDRSSAAM